MRRGGVEQGTLEASCLLGLSVCTECRRRDLAQSHHKGVTCRGRVADDGTYTSMLLESKVFTSFDVISLKAL